MVHETTFKYYIKNPKFKASKIRYEIKKLFSNYQQKTEFYEEVFNQTDEGVKYSYWKAKFSFNIALGFKNKKTDKIKEKKNALLILKIRTEKELIDENIDQIKKIIFGKSNHNKRKTQGIKNYKNNLKTTRYEVECKRNKIDPNKVDFQNLKIGISSPLFWSSKEATDRLSKPPKTQKEREKKAYVDLNKIDKNDVAKKLKNAIKHRFGEEIEIKILKNEGFKLGYIEIIKFNKYDEFKKPQKEYNKKYVSDHYKSGIAEQVKKSEKINKKGKNNFYRTRIKGIHGFNISLTNLKSPETKRKILITGLGGKAGLGMGFLQIEGERNE